MELCGFMWDSTTPELIPGWARLKALYINGRFASHPDYGRGRVYIDVTGAAPFAAEILDIETGDATPEHAPGWLHHRSQWETGTLYCNRDTLPHVVSACEGMPFDLWLATLDGTIPKPGELNTGSGRLVAVQAYGAAVNGVNVDLSAVLDRSWWARHALPPVR